MALHKISCHSNSNHQSGAALVVTLVVILALTVVAIGVTSSNQTQSIMVRNNQFRLEAFNASYSEIQAQLDWINNRELSEGAPDFIIDLIDGVAGGRIDNNANSSGDRSTLLLLKI